MRAVELSTLVMSSSLGLHKSGHIRVVIGMLQHRTYLVGRMLLVWFGVVWCGTLSALRKFQKHCATHLIPRTFTNFRRTTVQLYDENIEIPLTFSNILGTVICNFGSFYLFDEQYALQF